MPPKQKRVTRREKKEKMKTQGEEQVKKEAKPASSSFKSSQNKTIEKPDSIPEDIWKSFYEFGNYVADFILEVLAVDVPDNFLFASWDENREKNIVNEEEKEGRRRVCEYIVVERMKENELFVCHNCHEYYFNYKQALNHLSSEEHWTMGTIISKGSGIKNWDLHVEDFIDKLPTAWTYEELNMATIQMKRPVTGLFFPTTNFLETWSKKYYIPKNKYEANLIDNVKEEMYKMKSEIGRRAMAELHDHLAQGTTFCEYCNLNTSDRDEFHSHLLSWMHVKRVNNAKKDQGIFHACFMTTLVNVHRRDIINTEKTIEKTKMDWMSEFLKSMNIQETKIVRPESISADNWKNFYELGEKIANFLLDALDVFASGDFASWDKKRVLNIAPSFLGVKDEEAKKGRDLVCEYILIEKMKEKEFFCCDLCNMTFFNYKQTLIHFSIDQHIDKETPIVKQSGMDCYRPMLNSFTKLPDKFLDDDENTEENRIKRYGELDREEALSLLRPENACKFAPTKFFITAWRAQYEHLVDTEAGYIIDPKTGQKRFSVLVAMRTVMERVKSDIGRKAMAELHEHLEATPPLCITCGIKTGDRKGFYAHYLSHRHIETVDKFIKQGSGVIKPNSFDIRTVMVNVLGKDYI